MSVPVRYRPQALEEVEAVRVAYEARRAGLGARFVAAVERVVEAVQANPQLYGVFRRGVRATPVRGFPHVVYYKDYGSYVLVVAVQHGRRSARGWRDRL